MYRNQAGKRKDHLKFKGTKYCRCDSRDGSSYGGLEL